MKNTILIFILAGFTMMANDVYSQLKTHEFGLRLEGVERFQDFDFVYKHSLKKEDKFVRYRLVTFNIGSVTDLPFGNTALSIGVGWENRKPTNAKFQFAYGFDLGFDFSILIEENSGFRLQLGYILGVQYRISEDFRIGLETIPNVALLLSNRIEYTFNIGLDNPEALALTFVYVLNSKSSGKNIEPLSAPKSLKSN